MRNDLSFKKSLFYFSLALIVMELIIYRDFIFGDYYFLYKDLTDDSYTQCYAELYAKIESLKSGKIPQFDFHTALGQNKYAFSLEPVAITIAYLFFKNNVAESLIWIQLAYTFLLGIFLFCFFRKSQFHYLSSSIGAILFSFSGYIVGCSTWYPLGFTNENMLFALLLLALHYFLENKKLWLLPLTIAFIGIASTSILLHFAFLIVLIYLTLNHKKFHSGKQTLIILSKLTVLGLLGLGLANFLLLSNVHQMLQSPRGTGMYSFGETLKNVHFGFIDSQQFSTSILRLFSNNLQGIAENFKGPVNYFEAPFWYCGLLVLLLIPQLFHFLDKRNKLVCGSILGIFVLIAVVPYFRFSLWLFTGDYYRVVALVFILFLLYFATQAFDFIIKNKKVYVKTLFITLAFLMLLLISQKNAIVSEASPSIVIICFFLLVYTVIIFFWHKENLTNYLPATLLIFVSLEAISFATPTLMDRKIVSVNEIKKGKGYHDITQKIVAEIKNSDPSFFRLEKDYFSGISRVYSYNEAYIQDFNGSASYFSFHNANYIKFLKSINALSSNNEIGSRFVKGIRDVPEAMQLCSVKYFISNQDSVEKYQANFDFIKEINGYTIYKLRNNLSLGFTYSNYITENDFEKLSISQRRDLLNKSIVVDSQFATTLKAVHRVNVSDSTSTEHNQMKITSFLNNEIEGTINVKQSEILFFSIPYDDGWTLKIDDKITQKQKVFFGLIGAALSKGNHRIELHYEPPFMKLGIIISIVSLILFFALNGFLFFKK